MACPLCGETSPVTASECTKCDWVRAAAQPDANRRRNPRDGAAAFLSLVPGAGHIFKGYILLGWLLMLVATPVIITFAAAFTMFFGWLWIPVFWIGVATDAYHRRDLRKPPLGTRAI